MKTCFKCNKEKPLEDFYKHPQMADGRVNKCKECNKLDVRKNRKDNIEYYHEYDRKRGTLPHRVAASKAYQKPEAGKASCAKSKKKWLAANADKRAAHIILGNAVRGGRIEKPDNCPICWATVRINGHHDDYTLPLEVRWCCSKCHRDIHKGLV